MTATDDELIDLLEVFSAAFARQDAVALGALFDEDDVCFIASESLVLHDRARMESFFDGYSAHPDPVSFEWDSCQVSSDERFGWVSAFGREIRQVGDTRTPSPFRITLVCRRRADGWRISHLHGSTPTR